VSRLIKKKEVWENLQRTPEENEEKRNEIVQIEKRNIPLKAFKTKGAMKEVFTFQIINNG